MISSIEAVNTPEYSFLKTTRIYLIYEIFDNRLTGVSVYKTVNKQIFVDLERNKKLNKYSLKKESVMPNFTKNSKSHHKRWDWQLWQEIDARE